MRVHRIVVTGAAALALAAGAAAATGPAGAGGATVTRGEFHSFAVGAGLEIGGHAQMVRSADGRTQVMIEVSGARAGCHLRGSCPWGALCGGRGRRPLQARSGWSGHPAQ
jgi:hypothetical protein